jgi:saccharopine dehydrogenase-like NADP-dependent oxidoreductase
MLPPAFHAMVAALCLKQGKHFFTASYVSAEIKAMHEQALNKVLLFMMECGLEPGSDHMSALSLIHTIKEQDANITSFLFKEIVNAAIIVINRSVQTTFLFVRTLF